MASQEYVLVFERKIFDCLGPFTGLKFDIDNYLREIFAPGVLRFIPRTEAETDLDFKQLIPYVIMACDDKYLNYVRGKRAGETRLTGNRSIGIGGHINPIDQTPLFDIDFTETYTSAVAREVAEEVTVRADHSDNIVALLNDDSNEVGQVHLGLVHYWKLDSEKVEKREQMITQMTFKTYEELDGLRDTMETWSALCLDGLGDMKNQKTSLTKLTGLFKST